MALAVGVSGVECAASVSRMCIRLGEGAAGSEPRGSGLRISFWVSSTALLSQQLGDCFIFLFTMLLHCGVN